jgi:NAD(P)-dependent dehydrogenase (short-subunit alcohol dehydrogenase family)
MGDLIMPTALVIGASRGLGLGLVRELAGRGWTVTGTVRSAAGRGAVETAGGAAAVADITDPASIAALPAAPLDLLFINAGVSGPAHQDAGRATADEVGALFLTNALAPVTTARALLDRMAPGGVLAFMTSIMGSVAGNDRGDMELYRASKAALNSLTRSMVAKLDRPLTVLSLHPGWVRTDMGGAGADLDVETSVRGLVDVILARRNTPGSAFLDYSGTELPW